MITAVLPVLFIIAAQTAGEPQTVSTQLNVRKGTVSIPGELTGDIMPYMMCLTNAGNELLAQEHGASSDAMPQINAKAVSSCTPTRKSAAESALKTLDHIPSPIPTGDRLGYVEKILGGIDAVYETPISETAVPTSNIRTETNVVPDRYVVTPETAPIVERYNQCLFPGGSISWSADSGISHLDFKKARLSACGETRKWAVSAAISAYKPESGGEKSAAKFVTSMFDLIDADYLREP